MFWPVSSTKIALLTELGEAGFEFLDRILDKRDLFKCAKTLVEGWTVNVQPAFVGFSRLKIINQ
jgi:hypothetical protein